ncbi:Protein prenylyltransferase superfamily protein [Abeliophyllum distichum]|uniref:Protein prenylyltransferase superfamily protein n=1 Tax=Abeliophyllum distichum TaxID=126358 RepID=A0ABD1VYC3_9LAMI
MELVNEDGSTLEFVKPTFIRVMIRKNNRPKEQSVFTERTKAVAVDEWPPTTLFRVSAPICFFPLFWPCSLIVGVGVCNSKKKGSARAKSQPESSIFFIDNDWVFLISLGKSVYRKKRGLDNPSDPRAFERVEQQRCSKFPHAVFNKRMDTSNGNIQSLERHSTTYTPSIPGKNDLLSKLENILESDPLIDEVGFIHPSQFAALNGEVLSVPSKSSGGHPQPADEITKLHTSEANASDMFFWNREHKLGISTLVILPLYTASKDAFMDAHKQYTMLSYLDGQKDQSETASSHSIIENQVMKHSRALLLLSSDFGMAWNSRKLVVSKKQQFQMFMDELLLSALVLSHSPKSERAWSHRRWVIKMIAGKCPSLLEIVERESELVKMIAENSKMNYRAWNHRCWLVSYMPEAQVLHELQKSQDWAGLHVADNSCFHYRVRLLLRIVEDLQHSKDPDDSSSAELQRLLKEELDWVGLLIKRYVGREALWLHRRFLSLLWMKYFATHDQNISGPPCCGSTEICDNNKFVDNELKLYESCTIIPDE